MSAVVSQVPDSKAPGASTIEVERAVWHPGHPPINNLTDQETGQWWAVAATFSCIP